MEDPSGVRIPYDGGHSVTGGGKLRPQSRTATFVGLVKDRPVYLAPSGRTLEFDGNGKCVAGCP